MSHKKFKLLTAIAADYGTPQSRVRFIVIAVRIGEPLPPLLAVPTHYHRDAVELGIQLGDKRIWTPRIKRGRHPYGPVTIEDAIGDLPSFDWWVPNILRT
jgi:DNA (cytosine-5)-methyltransferase 1